MYQKSIPSKHEKWLRTCLTESFGNNIDKYLNEENAYASDVAWKIINSSEMTRLLSTVRVVLAADSSKNVLLEEGETKNESDIDDNDDERWLERSYSFLSELSSSDVCLLPHSRKESSQSIKYSYVIEKINVNNPVHLRLAGYETLLNTNLIDASNDPTWKELLKSLFDGLNDENRPIIQSSLQVYSKLLGPRFQSQSQLDVFVNILKSFTSQYHTKSSQNMLPTLMTGLHFKIFLHEKLFQITHLIIRYMDQLLNRTRIIDKKLEDVVENFIIFLSHQTLPSTGSICGNQTLDSFNIISVLDPEANWSKKWLHSLTTRKLFISALAKSPSLLQRIVLSTTNSLQTPKNSNPTSIIDEPPEVFISGETVKTLTYLHSLNILTQVISYSSGRTLLMESLIDVSFSVPHFILDLVDSLNTFPSSEAPSGVYDVMRTAFVFLLNKPKMLHDDRFYSVALKPLIQPTNNPMKICQHTLDILNYMCGVTEASELLINEYRGTIHKDHCVEEREKKYPILIMIQFISELLKQPSIVMNVEQVVELCGIVGKLLSKQGISEIVQVSLKKQFFPAVAHLYTKNEKYLMENDNKIQVLDGAIKKMVLRMSSNPIILQLLINEPLVLEELIQGLMAPLRTSWTSPQIVGFISSASIFSIGSQIIRNLAPHSLSTLLADLCDILENPYFFYKPTQHTKIDTFIHVTALFSLHSKCFIMFATNSKIEKDADHKYPHHMSELLIHCSDPYSTYHFIALLTLNTCIWNLDIYLYLLESFDFVNKLSELQEGNSFELETENDCETKYEIDESSFLRQKILMNSRSVTHKRSQEQLKLEDCFLNSEEPYDETAKLSPRMETVHSSDYESCDSLITKILEDSKPGLRDSSWIDEVQRCYKTSPSPMKHSVLLNLLEQMHQAIPTVEWTDHFVWQDEVEINDNYWLPEELQGMDLIIRYAKENRLLDVKDKQGTKSNMKQFFQASYAFIRYNKCPEYVGFDWFLGTVFILCNGDIEKCKTFVTQFVRFPSAMFVWPALGKVIDESSNEEAMTQLLFAQVLEDIISEKLTNVKYALKSNYGFDWWMVCNLMLSQCFLGIFPWCEIVHYFAISILYSADYIVYYCISLLQHSEPKVMDNIQKGLMWPQEMVLDDFRCHDYIDFMDGLRKRFGNKTLSLLSSRKLGSIGEID